MERNEKCALCGSLHPQEELYEFDGKLLCSHCLQANTVICQDCGNRIWVSENAGSIDVPLCRHCFDRGYLTCIHCGRLIREQDAYYEDDDDDGDNPFCSVCYVRQRSERVIRDYYYRPEPLFRGEGPRYFGVELEIDGAGESHTNAARILDIANFQMENAYIKHDGSLDDGMEIVTHPMSLDYHLKEMPWQRVLDEAISMGYLSHRANTCGLHIHVSRDAFGETEAEQDRVIARILFFMEKHWEELLKFSRRTQRQLDRWAARYGYKDHLPDLLDDAKKGRGNGRYSCLNLQNQDTIEFRVFRGTLKYNTLIATLQLVNRVCDVAFFMSDDELKAMSWTTFVAGCQEPELVQYLKERRLYVNDPVDGKEEV